MNRQFNPVPMVCPCCGYTFGDQAYFQSFETKVAAWLQGKVAPTATPGYDVFDTAAHPDWTFQVKYATAHERKHPNKQYPALTWSWVVKRLDVAHPDFFILFGVDASAVEYCFLLSRHDFLSAAYPQKDGRYIMRATAKRHSDRKNYRYVPKIWQYYVPNPESDLLDRVCRYEPGSGYSIFMQKYMNRAEEIRALQAEGLGQKAIGERLGISQTSVHRILKGGR